MRWPKAAGSDSSPPDPVRGTCAARRRGTVMVESAIVLGVFLFIVFGMLDVGLAVLRNNTLSEAARKVAREAIVHGELASPERTVWGPQAYSATADDTSEMAQVLRSVLVAMKPADVSLHIEWLDGGNAVDQRVRVTVSYEHKPMIPFILGGASLDLSAASTMRIVH